MYAIRSYYERYTDPGFLNELIETNNIDYCLVDSRDIQDYKKGHIKTAKNVPYYSIEGNLPSENLFTLMIVYGYTKRSSIKAAEVFRITSYNVCYTKLLRTYYCL